MVVWSTAFVVAEEEDGIIPLGTRHQRIDDVGHLRLAQPNRLARSRMFVIVAVTCLDEGETRERAVGEIGEVGRQRGDVGRIDAEGIRRIANHAGRLSGRRTGGAGRVLIQVLIRISQVGESRSQDMRRSLKPVQSSSLRQKPSVTV